MDDKDESSEPYQYLRKVEYPELVDMSRYVKETDYLRIPDFNYSMFIDCIVNKIEICFC